MLCYCIPAIAQITIKLYEDTALINGLQQQYLNAVDDSARAYRSFQLSYVYKRNKELPKAKNYLAKGLSLSQNNPFLTAASHYYQAYYLLGNSDLKSISNHARMADSQLAPFTHPEAYRIRSSNWLILGVLEQLSGNEKKGLDIYINKVLPFAEKSGNVFSIANANKFIGISLLNARERDKASTYLHAAWSGFEMATTESDALKQEAIVEVLLILAENTIFSDKADEGKIYLDKAYAILKKYPRSNAFLFYYVPEGQYYEKKGQLQRAITSYNKGIALQSNLGEVYYINRAKYLKFEVLRKQGRNQEAINVMQDLLKSKLLLPQDRSIYANLLAHTYALTGNMTQAYEWSQKYIALNDSLQVTQNKADILEIEQRYKTAEKEKQINSLKAEQKEAALQHKNQYLLNWLLGTGAVVCLLALVYVYSIYKNNKQRNAYKLKELQQQKELQVTQAVMAGEEQERQRIARELHDGLGGALSGIKIKLSGAQKHSDLPFLDETIHQLENSIGELRRIARNLMPETLIRSGLEIALRDLCVAFSTDHTTLEYQSGNIDKNIPLPAQAHIYRIVQELLSNSIRHGSASEILVQCIQNGHRFLIAIEDNGTGFDPLQIRERQGMGIDNIKSRVNLMKGTINIDSAPGTGTIVNIELYV